MRLRAGRHEEGEEEERKREIGRTAGAFYYISPFISRHFAFRISDNCSHGRGTFIIDFCSHDTIRLLNLLFCENSTCKNAYAFRASLSFSFSLHHLLLCTIWNAFINYVDIKYVALILGERSHMQHKYIYSNLQQVSISCWDIEIRISRRFYNVLVTRNWWISMADRCYANQIRKIRNSAALTDLKVAFV